MRVELQPAYVLHTRPYRDTSLLVDILSQYYGRLTLVAKGARRPKQQQRSLLQSFIPLCVSWQGNSQLKTLIHVEAVDSRFTLENHFLYSAMYVNELLNYLLIPGDPSPDIFRLYAQVCHQLGAQDDLQSCLRYFEFSLLDELGYGIDFTTEITTGERIQLERDYGFVADQGFIDSKYCDSGILAYYKGEWLLSIAQHQYHDEHVRRAAKTLSRLALGLQLGDKTLKSRELFKVTRP